MRYTIIVPVYNRKNEVEELLNSAESLDYPREEFEFLFVDDGSVDNLKDFLNDYHSKSKLNYRYIYQENSGPAGARNNGMSNSDSEYFLFLDSDCLLPPQWLKEIDLGIVENNYDAFGGPDTFHESFSPVLKAVNYSMTSFIGTGGIRGSEKSVEKFYPRSFNMGISKAVYDKIGGMRLRYYGEDTDFSARIYDAGFKVGLISEAFVYHKRRTSLPLFFKQISRIGMSRIVIGNLHKHMLKPIHLLPAMLILGLLFLFILSILIPSIFSWFWIPVFIGFLLICLLAFYQSYKMYQSIKIGFLSILALNIQVFGYGYGLLKAIWRFHIIKENIENK
ncbi:glycosyltransferase [uncultured Draconibacterium sp.]|uniref:glycosyltransferase n=1 Tax=uncultured Draconibacterium sp. TaxID=1573823 RepID=UPI002AA8262C|nr:glycosyltransferase [uncultured Draconibacterium sp.]